jgi:hypothetical protein
VQFKSTAPSISERSPLLSQFAWADSDTAALVNQLTDTLLAAEVSLENQVRLTEVLRKEFELKLAERERLFSSGTPQEIIHGYGFSSNMEFTEWEIDSVSGVFQSGSLIEK